jgi:CHAD domain-containing protein
VDTGSKAEVEAKFQIRSRGAGDRYLVAPEVGQFKAVGQVRSVKLEDQYVDTAEWALARAGFAARLRRTNRGTAIELKRQATPEGRLHHREELTGDAEPGAAVHEWPASPARSVILELCGDAPLVELLALAQSRDTRRLESGRTRATLSIDRVQVRADGRTLDSFEELEVELDEGPEEPLAALAVQLGKDSALRRSSRSKLEQAVRAMRKELASMPEETRRRWDGAPASLIGKTEPGRKSRDGSDAAAASTTEEAGSSRTGPLAVPAPEPGDAERIERPTPRTLGALPDDSLPEAARKILAFHFARLRAKEKGTRSGSNVEDLHDMRVAARRMRAAWRVFDDAFRPNRTKDLRRRLRTLSGRLGAVRDLDVLIGDLETYQAGLDPDDRAGLDPMLSLWRRQRSTARQLLMDELDAPRHARFMEDMESFLEAGAMSAATVTSPTLPHRVRDRLPSQIWAAYEAVRAYDLVLPWADIETLHQLRIASKWLRYDLEFFGETLGPDAGRLTDRVVALQDFLGCLHDADVAAKLARDVLVARAGELTVQERDAIGAYLHSREREVARRRRALGPVWRAVTGAPFRRALGRATAAL